MASYAQSTGAPVQGNTAVQRVHRQGTGICIETSRGSLQCRSVVLASGTCDQPNIPSISAAIPGDIFQTNSSVYKRPSGRLQHEGGVIAAPGLYVMGLTFMRRRRSHQISGVGADASELSAHMQGYLGWQRGLAA